MSIRDLDAVYALEAELFPNPWPRAFFEADLGTCTTAAYVVRNKERIVAYAMATMIEGKCHVTNIAVAPAHQREGIASSLMELLERIAVEKDCRTAYLEVRTANAAALRLYERRGYTIAYRRQHYYIDGDDAYVMEKELP